MTAQVVTDFDTFEAVLSCADDQFGLDSMMSDYCATQESYESLFKRTWLIVFMHEECLLGYILIEWPRNDTAIVHICKFSKCDPWDAWSLALPIITTRAKAIVAYIPVIRTDVLRLARMAGFKLKLIREREIYYGRLISTKKTRTSSRTSATAATSRANNSRG